MQEKLKLPETEKSKVPIAREARIRAIQELPGSSKPNFLPKAGTLVRMGPYVYRVSFVNAGDLRFTAKLHDVVIEGVSDAG